MSEKKLDHTIAILSEVQVTDGITEETLYITFHTIPKETISHILLDLQKKSQIFRDKDSKWKIVENSESLWHSIIKRSDVLRRLLAK